MYLVVPVEFLIANLWIINDYGFKPKPRKPLCVSAKGLGPLPFEGWMAFERLCLSPPPTLKGQSLLRRLLALTQRKTFKTGWRSACVFS